MLSFEFNNLLTSNNFFYLTNYRILILFVQSLGIIIIYNIYGLYMQIIYLYIILIIIAIFLWFIPCYKQKDDRQDYYYFLILIILSLVSGFILKERWYMAPILINFGQFLYLLLKVFASNNVSPLFMVGIFYILLQTILMLIPSAIGYFFS